MDTKNKLELLDLSLFSFRIVIVKIFILVLSINVLCFDNFHDELICMCMWVTSGEAARGGSLVSLSVELLSLSLSEPELLSEPLWLLVSSRSAASLLLLLLLWFHTHTNQLINIIINLFNQLTVYSKSNCSLALNQNVCWMNKCKQQLPTWSEIRSVDSFAIIIRFAYNHTKTLYCHENKIGG